MSATSHDLLQPINAARLFTAALDTQLGAAPDNGLRDIVGQIDGSLRRAEQLIAELREVARLDSGRQSVNIDNVYLPDLFRALAEEFGPQARQAGLALRVASLDVWLRTDQALLYRVLQNLLSNALRYTAEGGVLLGARRRGENVLVQVWDTGPGISAGDQLRVFEEFERGPRRPEQADKGLGLGLSIVQRISAMLELGLQLDSREERGSVFSLTLPLGEARAKPTAGEPLQGDLSGLSLLCIDNDPLILDGLSQLLSSLGAQVTTVANREALQEALGNQPPPDVILADYHLDDDDNGIAAVRHALAQRALSIPCVVISADDGSGTRQAARDAGFRFLPKPVNAARLRALVLALCRDERAAGAAEA